MQWDIGGLDKPTSRSEMATDKLKVIAPKQDKRHNMYMIKI
jgi:hypothetical protein